MSSRPAVELAARSIIYLGIEVHKDSITIAVLSEGAKAPTHLDRLPNDLSRLWRWLERMVSGGEVARLTSGGSST